VSDFKPDIWQLQAQFNTEGLVKALASTDAGIRKRAAAALRALGAIHTIPDLEKTLENEIDPETRTNIFSALHSLEQEKQRQETGEDVPAAMTKAEQLIAELKASTKEEDITRLAGILGHLGDKQAVEPLVILFNNAKLSIKPRLAVAEALLELESAPVEVALLGALRSPEWRVRRNGAAILGQLRAAWAIEPLGKALRDKNEVVRKTSYAALRTIGTPEARAVLKQAATKKTKAAKATGTKKKKQAPPPIHPDIKAELTWPNRKEEEDQISQMQTKPLDPDTVEKYGRKPGDQED
jgi:HEAT repeat protein